MQVLWPRKGAFDNANDLKEQPFYRFIAKTYWGHIVLQFALLYAIGGMQWFVWLGCVRVCDLDLQIIMVLVLSCIGIKPLYTLVCTITHGTVVMHEHSVGTLTLSGLTSQVQYPFWLISVKLVA